MSAGNAHTDPDFQRLVERDVEDRSTPAERELLRSPEHLARWRGALVIYHDRLQDELRGIEDLGERREVTKVLQRVQARFSEHKKLQKAANLERARELKAAAKERRRKAHEQRMADRAAGVPSARRSSGSGLSRLERTVLRDAVRLVQQAAQLAEQDGLPEDDEDWDRWMDDYEALCSSLAQMKQGSPS